MRSTVKNVAFVLGLFGLTAGVAALEVEQPSEQRPSQVRMLDDPAYRAEMARFIGGYREWSEGMRQDCLAGEHRASSNPSENWC